MEDRDPNNKVTKGLGVHYTMLELLVMREPRRHSSTTVDGQNPALPIIRNIP